MENLINIPRDVKDSHYRYKMPSLVTKVEGRGNGIKTRLSNIQEIASALDRPITYIVKFFGFELGAQTLITESVSVINGKHESEDLAYILDRFIDKYVVCGRCRNPETVMFIKKETPRMKCKACGYVTACDVSHRVANYIVKFPPAVEVKEETDDAPLMVAVSPSEVEDDDWAVSTEPEEVAKRQLAFCGGKSILMEEEKEEVRISEIIRKISPTENPLSLLAEFWASLPEDREVLFNIKEISGLCMWTEEDVIKNIFASQWMKYTTEGAELKAHYLSLFVKTESEQKHILRFMEKMATDQESFARNFQDILFLFWQERVLEEDIINKWFLHPNPKTPKKVSKFIRDRCEKLIKWLKEAPEEEDLPRLVKY